MRPPRDHETDVDVVVLLIVLYGVFAFLIIFNGIAPALDPDLGDPYIRY